MKPTIEEWNFHESVNASIKEGQHVEYLQAMLKEYEEYKRAFDAVFTDESLMDAVYAFRAAYLLKKQVWREIELLGADTFEDLARAIIKSMGWDNDHLHGFELLKRRHRADQYFTMSDLMFFSPYWEDDGHPTFKSDEIHICDIDYAKQPRLGFVFDFGDGHRFIIEYQGVRALSGKEKADRFPRIVGRHGAGPEQYPKYEE